MDEPKSRSRLYDKSEHAEIVAKIRALYDQGYTAKEAAGILGYAPGTVRQYARRGGFHGVTEDRCVFTNLRRMINANEISRTQLMQILGIGSRGSIAAYLRGETPWKEKHIKILIERTGMSRDELLQRKKP